MAVCAKNFISAGMAELADAPDLGSGISDVADDVTVLSLSGNVNLIWWAFPIAELVSVGMTTFFLKRINRNIISHIGETLQETEMD